MDKISVNLFFLLVSIILPAQDLKCFAVNPVPFKNYWTKPPQRIPGNFSVDAPLLGNGDLTMSIGFKEQTLRFYLSKNDFWRLRSRADGLSGPRVVGFVNLKIEGFSDGDFTASQLIRNGLTTCVLQNKGKKVKVRSWVSAATNLIFIEISAISKVANLTISLTAPENKMSRLASGKAEDILWLNRAFKDTVDISTEVSVALKTISHSGETLLLQPGKKVVIAIAVESKFKKNEPLAYVLSQVKKLDAQSVSTEFRVHQKWWDAYWNKTSVTIADTVLMKAWYQGLYTMAACSRDPEFPPGLFGWTTNDTPAWNGDYHLNYNFQAPFYSLFAANHLEQGSPQDAPLMDFIPRGKWYARNVTNTGGILYPVGIGPLGIETTRDFPVEEWKKSGNIEQGGLFWQQRSNAAYGLVNMAQHWRCTYDTDYGRKIYPYVLAVVNFWEDYLKFENGRYVIYGDAIHEGSGKDKNPLLSLGLIQNALDLVIDLSSVLKEDEERQAKWKDILAKLSEFPVQMRNGRKVFRYTEQGVDWVDGNGLGIQQIYPCNAITLDSNPELLEVARNTIDEMQRWQDMNTSNSFFVAAIRVGYDSSKVIRELHNYALHTFPNGFQLDNPHGIENSCTVTNTINEMLCMSVGNVIRLFSHYPKDQKAGFKNLRTWGAFLVSASLNDGIVSDLNILSEKGKPFTIINPWAGKRVVLIRNGKTGETVSGVRISFQTSPNEEIKLRSLSNNKI